ncbi:MAG: TIGR02328 family protein [Nitrosopumilaceae archaeon]|jgi:uncharacterized protein (TIGR02328 family)
MRLWHETLLPHLPTLQFNGQHRECCALRGNGWDKKHSTVEYIHNYSRLSLYEYHRRYLILREIREYEYDLNWLNPRYRGKNCPADSLTTDHFYSGIKKLPIVYPEHNQKYLLECIELLLQKIQAKPKQYTKKDIQRLVKFNNCFSVCFDYVK